MSGEKKVFCHVCRTAFDKGKIKYRCRYCGKHFCGKCQMPTSCGCQYCGIYRPGNPEIINKGAENGE